MMGIWVTETCQDAEALGRSICKKQPRCAAIVANMDGFQCNGKETVKSYDVQSCIQTWHDLAMSC